MARPDTGADALVQRIGRKVRAAGPAHRSQLGIDADLCKSLGRSDVVEHWSLHAIEHVDLANDAVSEREPQRPVM
jgi:hypothetical protein